MKSRRSSIGLNKIEGKIGSGQKRYRTDCYKGYGGGLIAIPKVKNAGKQEGDAEAKEKEGNKDGSPGEGSSSMARCTCSKQLGVAVTTCGSIVQLGGDDILSGWGVDTAC